VCVCARVCALSYNCLDCVEIHLVFILTLCPANLSHLLIGVTCIDSSRFSIFLFTVSVSKENYSDSFSSMLPFISFSCLIQAKTSIQS
jgi:hypothetical protein